MTTRIQPLILSGGSGSRLWPMSRTQYPKQLLPLLGQETMLQATVSRLDGLTGVAAPMVVCNQEHRFLVAEQLRAIQRPATAIVLEPVGRNTAPAVAVAALALEMDDPDAVLLVLPADHHIADIAAFHSAIEQAARAAAAGHLVTFGIVPTAPETGYGYIQTGAPNGDGALCVSAFIEKPDLARAQAFLAQGDHFWNSGMFAFRPGVFLEEIAQHAPEILAAARTSLERASRDLDFIRLERAAFEACPADSIDYAVMEKTRRAVVVPANMGWSDIGSWTSLWAQSTKNAAGNAVLGDVLTEDATDCLIRAESRLVAAVGVEHLIIVETADAVLVAHKDAAQSVKQIVAQLDRLKRPEAALHRRVYRPWGWYEGVDEGSRFQVKRLMVNPGQRLSLQMHHHRAEHWVVVSGTAKVTRGDETMLVAENQSTFIPLGTKHRLENPGQIPLHLIEVQSGGYLGEDDIVRMDDDYRRA